MQKSLVVNPNTLGSEYRAFIEIDMVHELDLLSGDSTELTLARTELGSKLAKVAKSRNFGGKLPATHTPLPLFHLIPLPWLSFPSPHMLGQVLIMIRVGYGSFP